MYQSVITPEGDKPWMDLPREGAYLRRCREAVPGVTAVCKLGRQANYNIFIAMKKMSEGDPGRAAAAALTFDHAKNVFVFDDDIDVFNPTDVFGRSPRACNRTCKSRSRRRSSAATCSIRRSTTRSRPPA